MNVRSGEISIYEGNQPLNNRKRANTKQSLDEKRREENVSRHRVTGSGKKQENKPLNYCTNLSARPTGICDPLERMFMKEGKCVCSSNLNSNSKSSRKFHHKLKYEC